MSCCKRTANSLLSRPAARGHCFVLLFYAPIRALFVPAVSHFCAKPVPKLKRRFFRIFQFKSLNCTQTDAKRDPFGLQVFLPQRFIFTSLVTIYLQRTKPKTEFKLQ